MVAAVGGVGVWWCGVVAGGEGLGAGGSRDRTNSVYAGARGERLYLRMTLAGPSGDARRGLAGEGKV